MTLMVTLYFAEVGCQSHARSPLIQGVLLTFQQLCTQSVLSPSTIKLVGWYCDWSMCVSVQANSMQAFCFTVSALLYCNGNTLVSALETLHQLLLIVNAEFEGWLLSTDLTMQVIELLCCYVLDE